ncbi:MAG: peptide MFS transporter [Ignavibacteria bacterium]|jgi:POT family proton-dependent oligopeptide transporter
MSSTTREFLGHPIGLSYLFFTEMWERFSYYGMRALLVLYMTQYLLIDPSLSDSVIGYTAIADMLRYLFGDLSVIGVSSQIYGLYTGFVYFTPFIGGLLADKYLGKTNAVYAGAILMAIGHFLMAFEPFFLFALVFLILGNGLFKPNLTAQVGSLYQPGDSRVDSAYTIYYMGVNLGAFFSPIVCGTLGQKVGWHYGFAAAGIGMLVGTFVYWRGTKHLPKENQNVIKAKASEAAANENWVRPLLVIGYLCFVNILFWGVFEQQGNALQVWADEKTNWNLLGIDVPSSWFQTLNPFFIIVFAPLLNKVWGWQRSRKSEPSSIVKMAIGCAWMAVAFLLMMFVANIAQGDTKINLLWVTSVVLLFTIGELYLSPIGQAMVSKVAPARMVSMFMGVWFLSSFFGNYLAGFIGAYYDRMSNQNYFAIMVGMSLLAVVMFLAPYKKLAVWIEKKV